MKISVVDNYRVRLTIGESSEIVSVADVEEIKGWLNCTVDLIKAQVDFDRCGEDD